MREKYGTATVRKREMKFQHRNYQNFILEQDQSVKPLPIAIHPSIHLRAQLR